MKRKRGNGKGNGKKKRSNSLSSVQEHKIAAHYYTALLGNIAFRTGKKIEWDPVNLKATNCPEAAKYVQREYRKGWSL
ncbi:MAG: hypothetical protein AUI63_04025 [Gemmatimonadetes bacterium 13_1_40CM_2_60_3]|nr:MAG: hypothetical protein AUI63_04025 [Gemmatimonadetes bacterium 13_1_40CM_2_60_3]